MTTIRTIIDRCSVSLLVAGGALWHLVRRLERNRLIRVEVLVVIVVLIFHAIPDETKAEYNRLLLVFIGSCYLISIIGMLWFTRKWTIRGASVMSTFQGEATLYLGLGLAAYGYAWQTSLRTDTVRASFLIGGTLLVWSVFRMFRDRMRSHQHRLDIMADDVVFAALAAAMPVIVAQSNGTIANVTPSFEDLVRAYPGELEGKNLTTIIPERYRERHLAGIKRFLETGESRIIGSVVAVELLRRDGSEIPVSLALTAADVDGHPWFVGVIFERIEMVDEPTAEIQDVGESILEENE